MGFFSIFTPYQRERAWIYIIKFFGPDRLSVARLPERLNWRLELCAERHTLHRYITCDNGVGTELKKSGPRTACCDCMYSSF